MKSITNQQESALKLRFSPLTSIAIILVIFSCMMIIIGVVQQLASPYTDAKDRITLLVSAVIQDIAIFIIPALLSAYFLTRKPASFLQLTKVPSFKAFVGVLLIFVIGMPAMNQLVYWNENIVLPDWAAPFGDVMRQMEDQAQQITDTILATDSFMGMIVNFLVIAVTAAVSEELFFRGLLQNTFRSSGIKKHLAIWCTAFIFSLLHFQFFGFIPRMILGAFFGYIVCWTGSLYPAIFVHILNNGTVVVLQWLTLRGFTSEEWQDLGAGEGLPLLPCISAVLLVLALIYLRKPLFFNNK